MCGKSFVLSPRQLLCTAALPALLWICGGTPLWPQSSGPSSRNSDEHLMTWEALSSRFALDLEQHEQTLSELGQKLQTSEAGLQRLTPLYELSLRQNESLKIYNGQIAERMQERDEDLAKAYSRIDALEKRFLKAVIVIVIMGLFITGAAAFTVWRKLKG